jgi:hypothetical protein
MKAMKQKNKKNSTGMLEYAIKGCTSRWEAGELGYKYGWMAAWRISNKTKSKTQEQIKFNFEETLKNKNNSFESLYTILEYLMSPRNAHQIEYNKEILHKVFSGKINSYNVLDHIMDRMYKNC